MPKLTWRADPAAGGMRGLAWTAVAYGARGWSTFGLAEASLGLVFAAAFPTWVPREVALVPLTMLTAVAYPAIGALVVGAIIGLAFGVTFRVVSSTGRRGQGGLPAWPSRQAIDAGVMLSVLAALTITLASGDVGRRTVVLCTAGSVGLAGASIARAVWPTRWFAVLGSPWFVALAAAGVLHLSLAAIARGDARGAVLVTVVWLVALAGVAFVLARLPRVRPERRSSVFGHAAAWVGLLVLAWMGDGGMVRTARGMTRLPQADAPNVVLITMDTVRRDHLSVYGYDRPTAPNLSALAGEATLYTAAVSTGNMTLTSHASLFTGRYASSHGAIPPTRPLPANIPTLAERLRAAGYRTAAIVGNRAYLHPSLGLARGFDDYDCRLPDLHEATRPLRFPRDAIVAAYARLAGVSGPRPFYRRAGAISREAVRWLDTAADRQRPFLLFLNYMDAHRPYVPPEPYASRFARTRQPIAWDDFSAMKHAVMANERRMTDDERRALIDAYDGAIAYVDAEIGRLLDALRARGLFDDTLIVITADHGEAFDEHGVVEHGVSLFEHQVGVPLIVKLPLRHALDRSGAGLVAGPVARRATRARVVREPVSGADLMPTILDLAGEPVPAGLDGRSLLRLDTDDRESPRYVFAEAFPRPGGVARAAFAPDGRKLIVDAAGGVRLFDLAVDPGERDDARSRYPTDLAWMTASLETTFSADRRGALRTPPAAGTPADAEVLQQLRALSYVK